MKNIRKFEMMADKDTAVLEEYSVSYVNENDKVYTTPENGGQGGDTVKNYMRFTAVEDSQINLTSINPNTGEADTSVDLKHSKDGVTWTQYDFKPIPLAAEETLYLKGNNENGFGYGYKDGSLGRICTFGEFPGGNGSTNGLLICSGNIMSLLYGDDFEDKTIIPSVACFYGLFVGCTSLTTAPELPATTLADACYNMMFGGCTSLTTAPELPAITLADACYLGMFKGCTNLSEITMLATDMSANGCLSSWVDGVSSTGTFVKHPDMNDLPLANADNDYVGIPESWVVEDYQPN